MMPFVVFSRRFALLALVAALLVAGSAERSQAQTAPEDPPLIDLAPMFETLPPELPGDSPTDETTLTVPEYARRGESPQGPSTVAEAARDILVPLQIPRGTGEAILRLIGEQDSATLFVDVPVPAAVETLVLSYRTSINVLPERSELQISVNGTPVAPVRPTAFEGFETLELPRDLLTEGRNSVTVTARQAHRIFCGPDASFEIWTELDLNASGIRVAPADLPADPTGLAMAFSAQLALGGAIPVRIEDSMRDRVLPVLATRLGALREAAPVLLRPQPLYEAETALARITVLSGPPEPPEIRRGGDGAIVLVLSAEESELTGLDTFLKLPDPLADIEMLEPGRATALGDLGFDDTTGHNRYDEQRLTFRLPDDWLMLSSREAVLRLTYGFADALPEGALMLVKLNDTTVRLLPLDIGGGEILPPLDIGFPAPLLNPGPNDLSFVTVVPGDPPGLPCPAVSGPILEIMPESTLLVPPTPKMRFTGVRAPLLSLRPEQIVSASGPQSGPSTLALALETALRPLAGTERVEGLRLTVASSDSPEGLTLSGLGLGRRDLDAVFQENRPAELSGPITNPAFGPRWIDFFSSATARIWRNIRELALPGDPPLAEWIRGRSGVAVLIMPDATVPEALWLLASPRADPSRLASALTRARIEPDGPKGRFALLTAEGAWQNWQPAGVPPRLQEPLTPRNFRQVAGNYASWAPVYFVTGLFALTLISVALALIFVITTRGRRKL